jgi:hypothetical protein
VLTAAHAPLLLSAASLLACLLGLRLASRSRLAPARRRVAPARITPDWYAPFRGGRGRW